MVGLMLFGVFIFWAYIMWEAEAAFRYDPKDEDE